MKYFDYLKTYNESPDEQLKKVFDELEEMDPEVYENRTIQGWSFVQGNSIPNAGNQ